MEAQRELTAQCVQTLMQPRKDSHTILIIFGHLVVHNCSEDSWGDNQSWDHNQTAV